MNESNDPAPEDALSGTKRVALALLQLVASLLPEVLSIVLFGGVGLVVGAVWGVVETSELLMGLGVWVRAGPIALLLPVLTFVGPTLGVALVSVFVPLPVVLAVHSLSLVPFPRRDRHVVVWATTIGYWLPGVLGLLGGPQAALVGLFVVGPFVATLGLLGSLTWFGARLILRGRPLRVWWDTADRSMIAAAVLSTTAGAAILWGGCILFPLLPASPPALLLGLVLGVRLAVRARRVGTGVTIAGVAALHLMVEVAAVVLLIRGDEGGAP